MTNDLEVQGLKRYGLRLHVLVAHNPHGKLSNQSISTWFLSRDSSYSSYNHGPKHNIYDPPVRAKSHSPMSFVNQDLLSLV